MRFPTCLRKTFAARCAVECALRVSTVSVLLVPFVPAAAAPDAVDPAANAPEYQVELPVAAYHLGGQTSHAGKPYNDSQFKSVGIGLGVRRDRGSQYVGAKAGSYENSLFCRTNYLVGDAGWRLGRAQAGAMAGFLTGYRRRFAIAPYVEVSLTKDLSANITFIQTTSSHGHSALGLSAGYHF
jgi:hypothetical protein